MFVEIVRLFIVLLATAAGFAVGGGEQGTNAAGNGAIAGAVLGACVGYVGGGVLGRLLDSAIGAAERRVEGSPAHRLLAGGVGAIVLGGLAGLVMLPAAFVFPPQVGWSSVGLVVWVGAFLGYRLGAGKSDELLAMAGLSSRPLAPASSWSGQAPAVMVDSSAVVDGRLLPLARAGFLHGPLLVPCFVVDRLRAVADAADPARRRRGRRGLEMLDALRRQSGVVVHVLDEEVPEHDDLETKVVTLARRLGVALLTIDEGLQRTAELQGVRCLSLRRLSEGLRPVYLPGERARIPIVREGREEGQGVGFLDDGTMVVVGGAAALVGQEVDVRITGNVETSVGRMLFGSVTEP